MLINCRQATRLISQSMDTALPWYRRMAIRIHLLYCVWCRRYAAQVRVLRAAAKCCGSDHDQGGVKLSDSAKELMRARLNQAARNESGTPPPGSAS
jgi:hypothetical protein